MPNLALIPFLALLYREIRRFAKVAVQTVITPLITSSLYLLIFGVSLGQSITLTSGVSYLAFIIPGLMMMGVLNNSYQNSSATIVSGKFSGDLQDLKVSPLGNGFRRFGSRFNSGSDYIYCRARFLSIYV